MAKQPPQEAAAAGPWTLTPAWLCPVLLWWEAAGHGGVEMGLPHVGPLLPHSWAKA